ncbi:GFA family protein [Granulosicoccus antarcticus]|uniref:GFA family protein n=1 Tax=Granulosicoccus antarcticus TaxID=437505 RepID=UPI000B5A572E
MAIAQPPCPLIYCRHNAVAQCHCTDCQKSTGGGTVLVVMIPKSNLNIVKGSLKRYSKDADSTKSVTRCFCENCGTPLYSELELYPSLYAVKSGVWDQDPKLEPGSAVWTSSAPE